MPGIGFNRGRRDNNGNGTGTGGSYVDVKFGWVPATSDVNISLLQNRTILDADQQYFILPPALGSAGSGSPTDLYNFVIAEPDNQPQKTATLWVRNEGTIFVHQPIAVGNIFSQDIAAGYRIYRSSDIMAMYADGSYCGPVFLSTVGTGSSAGGGGLPPAIYAYWVGIGTTPCTDDGRIVVWSNADTFAEGIELFLNRALTIPAGSGQVAVYEALNGGTVVSEGEIFTITTGTVGATTGIIC